MFQIICDPPVSEAHVFKFDNQLHAVNAARELALTHTVSVTLLREISVFSVGIVVKEIE